MTWFGKPNNKTEHQYFEERLSAYLDGELAPRERDAVQRHVATCQACQWDLDTLRQTVRWTRELPTVPIPRVFTVPVAAQPARVTQRRWRFVPVLQAATALVALLLVFAVGGDFLLGGFRMGYAPETMSMQEPPAATVEATIVVEVAKEVEAPVAEGETVIEKMVVETVEVEIEMPASTATPPPQATAAPKPAEPVLGEATQAAAAAPEEGENALAPPEGEEEALPAEPPGDETARAAVPAPAAGGAPTPTEMATVSPTQVAAYAAPTLLAEGQEQADVLSAEQERAPARTLLGPGINWLRMAEIVLAVSFLFLMAATIFVTVQRRRIG